MPLLFCAFLPCRADDGEAMPYLVVDLETGASRYCLQPPDINDDVCRTKELWLRHIPAGTFTMGSNKGEVGVWKDHDMTPHQVTITKEYYIGIFEITQKQWLSIENINPSCYQGECRPVERVSFKMIRGDSDDAGAGWPKTGNAVDESSFLDKLRKKTGLLFDLPTDAEWEYACRAETVTSLNSGKNLLRIMRDPNMAEVGRYYSNRSDTKGGFAEHTKVGCYKPNAWGLYDMHGNVSEWCLDWWGSNTFSDMPETDPKGMPNGITRVMRGGSWIDYAQYCRSGIRRDANPLTGYHYFGFRVTCRPNEK
ncbi:MAG: formylglycine-generating enzyme family protein [Victivallales bacterium]|nr:formylglycine-generating enzyme family protein [Victivallales bacterium]